MTTLASQEDPVAEINKVLHNFQSVARERQKISRLAETFHFAGTRDQVLFVLGKIFDYGFEKYPLAFTPECEKFIREIFKDTERLSKGSADSPEFIKGVRYTRELIRTGEIQGWEHIENAILIK